MNDYTIVRSQRKTLAIHVKPDGMVEVRAPLRFAKSEIRRFVSLKSDWIIKAQQRVAAKMNSLLRPLPPPLFEKEEFLHVTRLLVSQWEIRLNVKTSYAGFRTMTSRWGSCTPKTRRIRLNSALAYCPRECLEYVVVHELAHLLENNHSKRFWAIVSNAVPDYVSRRKALKDMQWVLINQNGKENDGENAD